MLVSLLIVWMQTTTTTRTATVPDTSRAEAMGDTLPYGNKFGIPFTRDEYKRALLLVFTEEEAEAQVRELYDPDSELIGVTVMDGTLYLLAALSPELADRVVAYRPSTKPLADRIRADPEAAIRSLRRGQ